MTRPLLDPGMGNPVSEVTHRAPTSAPIRDGDLAALPDLIGFRPAKVKHDPLPDMLDIAAVEPDQFGSTERSGEADQQQCLIAQVDWPLAHSIEDCEKIVALQCPCLALGHALPPSDPAHRRFHDFCPAGIVMTKGTVRLRNCGEPPLDRRGSVGRSQIGQILRQGVRWTGDVPAGCPEMGKVGRVAALGASGEGRGYEALKWL
ncbi:MAG: hypothetical protein AB7E24_15895 [Novosphingobium sp.]